ncbi:MAG: glycoside hydrolase family 99-like domain-containing protein [Clostridia bacterium]|nr:glycoside hydrolase family 99-like domain-containing protein [Clostridia bacterium]
MKDEYLVGINYFCGWNRGDPNRWQRNGKDWRAEYPERIPVLGCYNDIETMRAEIDCAAEKGVDFFQMLWYVQKPEREKNSRHLNDCFKQFFECENNYKLKFLLEFCNHPPYEITDDDLWRESVLEWTDIMKHPSCLKIDGKPVFKVHGLNYFYVQCGEDINKVKRRLDLLRKVAREKGLGDIIIGAGVMSDAVNDNEIKCSSIVDYVTTYADFPKDNERQEPYPFTMLTRQAAEGRKRLAKTLLAPYVPFVMSGWYPRPWGVTTAQYAYPTEDEWRACLERLKKDLDENEEMRIYGKKMFTVYAWNEFGEGGIMAPTIGFGSMRLDVLKNVFKEQ